MDNPFPVGSVPYALFRAAVGWEHLEAERDEAEADRLRELVRRAYNGLATGNDFAKDRWLADVRAEGIVRDAKVENR